MTETLEHPDVVTNPEREPLQNTFDAVVVHGFGIEKKTTQERVVTKEINGETQEVKVGGSVRYEPQTDGKMRAIAAAELVIEGKTDLLIFSGGQTYFEGKAEKDQEDEHDEHKPPTEAGAMEEYTKRLLRLEIRNQINKLKKTDDEDEQRDIRKQIYRLSIDGDDPIEEALRDIENEFGTEPDPERKRELREQEVRLRKNIDLGEVDKIRLIREEDSVDTSTNLEKTINKIRENKWEKVLYFTNRYHTARVKKLVELMYNKKQIDENILEGFVIPDTEETLTGLRQSSIFGTEEMHGGRRSHSREKSGTETSYRPLVDRFYRSPGMVKRKALEAGNRLLLLVDPDAKIAKKLAEKFRSNHSEEELDQLE